ncbi:hypothetical protein VJ923_05490 [Adlercreutzia sp. R25]|uniref:hypothetical protein n=1 Tax=Adlercreutzia shanghongiae TaxID=3111773 RepID=UPI002DBE60A4|nr:hypothetical protein [Adlercreutzia sp. R25]MEC4272609.1 hypothetical protein [Adlercreutzia sp. R25]
MARGDAFEGLVWEEVGGSVPGSLSGTTRGTDRPVPEHVGRPHPDRARQFMPFAALRGYYELVRDAERVAEPRVPLADDEARALDEAIAGLVRGDVVRCVFYERDGYRTLVGAVGQVDLIYRDLWIVRERVPFSRIRSVDVLYPAG